MSSDHEYIINQFPTNRLKLNFNHPVDLFAQQELLEKKFEREYLNFSLTKLNNWESIMYDLTKKLDHIQKTKGIPPYYFYKKFNLN